MKEQRCENCRFWQKVPQSLGNGWCRRNAPRPLIDPETQPDWPGAYWPATDPNEWCGEHQSTPKDDPLRSIADAAFYIEHIAGYLSEIRDQREGR